MSCEVENHCVVLGDAPVAQQVSFECGQYRRPCSFFIDKEFDLSLWDPESALVRLWCFTWGREELFELFRVVYSAIQVWKVVRRIL
jgi:hypothetical protein